MTKEVFLICTVGGTPEPVVYSIKEWRPEKIVFVASDKTKGDVKEKIVPCLKEKGFDIDRGRYDLLELSDPENLEACIEDMSQLTTDVHRWIEGGEGSEVVVDFTGGTKCMSAALVLVARRWPCTFSYVGGKSRTKEGIGVVISGQERAIYQTNPWSALGYQDLEEFTILFDQGAFCQAAKVASRTYRNLPKEDKPRKDGFAALEKLAKAFDAWERFAHKKARDCFREVLGMENHLKSVLGADTTKDLKTQIENLLRTLDSLVRAEKPSKELIKDLLANAYRRAGEGKYDDAVARLYRSIEALAQLRLKEKYGIDTASVPSQRVHRAENSKTVSIGLRDAYSLLKEEGDPLGERFASLGLADHTTSPLQIRNNSILAHGFEPVSEDAFEALWQKAFDLAELEGISKKDLPQFPKPGNRAAANR